MCKRVIIVCGQTGAGKTTYSIELSEEIAAIRFSIDLWMQTLFAKDMTSLDFSWMMERVERCQKQIWDVGKQVLNNNGNIVLDLGFTTKSQRDSFVRLADSVGVVAEIHYVRAPTEVRQQRVATRNREKDPAVYAFEVTDEVFSFMEPRFEIPNADELRTGRTIDSTVTDKSW